MDSDPKELQNEEVSENEEELTDRRGFLMSLGKWSKIVIGGALLGSALLNSPEEARAAGWANRGGGGGAWANRSGGGGAWANRSGGGAWANRTGGGGAWANRSGGGGVWANRGAAWANHGGVWVNRY